MNANSGYCGWSKSWRAVEAEADGKLPLTRAIEAVAKRAGCTKKAAREALKAVGPCEWHHTSKHFNRTDFYDCRAAARYLALANERAGMERFAGDRVISDAVLRGGNTIEGGRREIDAAATELAAWIGTDAATILEIYYGTWGEQ